MRSFSPKTNIKMRKGDSMTMTSTTDSDVLVEVSVSHVRSKANKADMVVSESVVIKSQPKTNGEAYITRTTAIVTKTQLVVIEYEAEEKEKSTEGEKIESEEIDIASAEANSTSPLLSEPSDMEWSPERGPSQSASVMRGEKSKADKKIGKDNAFP